MHHLGNDFLITYDYHLDLVQQALNLVPLLADRHTGVGFDQMILVNSLPKKNNQAAFSCTIFNADGSEAEQCGNGLCCVVKLIYAKKIYNQAELVIATKAGLITAIVDDQNNIKINIGVPQNIDQDRVITLDNGSSDLFTLVSLGNPHAIVESLSLDDATVTQWGIALNRHQLFPAGVNLGVRQILQPQHIRLRTYERGVGLTLACGTNACAAVVAGIRQQLLVSPVIVEFALGRLIVEWSGNSQQPIWLTGAAKLVFSGELDLNNWRK
jgi:diaminopimelate epimerase